MESQTGSLTIAKLVDPREDNYFYVAVTFAAILWLALVICTVGLAIVFIGFFVAVVWLTHGLLVARLRSESVRITPQQYPELHATFLEVCQRLSLAEPPELYILQHGGVLNAFATRHTGRNFVVIYSNFVEILGPTSAMMKFLMGHEIGHIQRKHLFKRPLLAPAFILPLIGEAYHRATEATCDRFGAYASNDLNASMLALTVLASGREASHVDTRHFADQHYTTRGFFVSWHELISTYPTLSQRVANILRFQNEQYARRPGRHFLAYVFAFLFTPKNIIIAYFGVIFISVLIGLGNQVKQTEARVQQQLQEQQNQNAYPPH
jgi:Zn-dependent protease with chaperone function